MTGLKIKGATFRSNLAAFRREELGRQFDPEAEHGSDSRYRSGCRCDECTIGQRVRTRRLHLVGES